MKKIVLILCLIVTLFVTIGCEKPKITLQGSKWKLVGIGSLNKTALQELEPHDCEECYTLTFDIDNTLSGYSVSNVMNGEYMVNYKTKNICMVYGPTTYIAEEGDGNLYIDIFHLEQIQSFSLQQDELRLYYNNEQNYLQFKSQKP